MTDAVTPRRIRVVGVSGSGKSRLASQIAERTGLARLELDAVFWGADWTFRDLAEARQLVREFVAAHPDGWVIDGNWTSRLEGLLDPGMEHGPDEVVWLDHPRALVMSRVVRRTLWRGIRRQELWHGNRERPSTWLRLDPDENIMLWSWTQHAVVRRLMLERMDAGWPVTRLRSQREVDAWLKGLGALG
ncbi:toxin [Microbacterium sp. NPDC019599]|uniref:toxin n=1 Tax=Microbacterium sp. NPDC019599 TaxID=3154690 RepID=UPI003401F88E